MASIKKVANARNVSTAGAKKVVKSAAGLESTSVNSSSSATASVPTLSKLIKQEQANFTGTPIEGKSDLSHLAHKIAVEVSFSLAEKVEELNVYNSEFRAALFRITTYTLNTLYARKERCLVVPDAIPGFTLMSFKKTVAQAPKIVSSAGEKGEIIPTTGVESRAAALIIGKFFEKEKDQVLVIECKDALFILFPVKELKANLKMLGFYYTE